MQRGLSLLTGLGELAASPWYVTEPCGLPGGEFLNAAARLEWRYGPAELMAALLNIEQQLGRDRSRTDRARTLDLDLLLFGDLRLRMPGRCIPHPRMHERAFVLAPLADIAPAVRHPVLGATTAEMLGRVDRSGVRRWREH